jgi:hypothetical protein
MVAPIQDSDWRLRDLDGANRPFWPAATAFRQKKRSNAQPCNIFGLGGGQNGWILRPVNNFAEPPPNTTPSARWLPPSRPWRGSSTFGARRILSSVLAGGWEE